MHSESLKKFAFIIIVILFIALLFTTYQALGIAERTQVGTKDGIYTSYVTTSKEIDEKAYSLSKGCQTETCKVQKLLHFVTNIPYESKTFQRYSPQKTIQQNFGDCDDKSNLLISMLHALHIEAYFVLVPKHIFVIVPLDDERLKSRKGLWVNGRKYYILESTAKDSPIGFPLHYRLHDIATIVEPFSNTRMDIKTLEYKL